MSDYYYYDERFKRYFSKTLIKTVDDAAQLLLNIYNEEKIRINDFLVPKYRVCDIMRMFYDGPRIFPVSGLDYKSAISFNKEDFEEFEAVNKKLEELYDYSNAHPELKMSAEVREFEKKLKFNNLIKAHDLAKKVFVRHETLITETFYDDMAPQGQGRRYIYSNGQLENDKIIFMDDSKEFMTYEELQNYYDSRD